MFDAVANSPQWYTAILGMLFGGMLASFTLVVVERVPAGVSINGRSRCACGRTLKARENIPVVGWLLTRGTAACCGQPLAKRLLVWEIVAALVGAGAGYLGLTALGAGLLLWALALTGWAVPAGLSAARRRQQ